jgi:RNA recognition motif-containing protein
MANKTLYVGNLPYDTSEDDLRELFGQFGPIEEIRLIGDKGFAFVDVPAELMNTAIEDMNGKDFNGRTLTVNEARPRTERRSSGGGFGGGGGRGGGFGGGGGGSRGGRPGGGGGGGGRSGGGGGGGRRGW